MKGRLTVSLFLIAWIILSCVSGLTEEWEGKQLIQEYSPEQLEQLDQQFADITFAKTIKPLTYDAPVMIQRFGADPYALVYQDRVYLYMTADLLEKDASGKVINNTYSKINTLNVVSSADLINWTDHGRVAAAGPIGAAKWGGNSWAPAVACKEIDGVMKFFIYFANGGNGIGVLQADSPTGPFIDPIGRALVSRTTPNCANVTWLFDPAVLVDEDGSAYLYFGGGIPEGRVADPGTARVVKLGEDMISLDGDPVAFDVPFLFEDSGINRIGDTYYYSYCSNWQMTAKDVKEMGFDNAQIVYMTSDSPMGPFTLGGPILKNPGAYYGCYGNNHHCIFKFHDEWYIAYHTQMLEKPLKISGGYRSTSVSKITVNEDGSIPLLQNVTATQLQQVGCFDPYQNVNAATMSTNGGVSTTPIDPNVKCGDMALCKIHPGDWVALRGVDFGEGAATYTADIRVPAGQSGSIQIRLDKLGGPVVGYLTWDAVEQDELLTLTSKLIGDVSGVHDLVFVFAGENYTIERWRFGK